ncbi:rhamnosidase B precursor [Aspergillus brunneoviolaceus CBS 621.78]|uniref:Rhamnosidase B n=1 Tax=Aspergillus brunneoviolaceus CBS 621.78 TaxID=1450534 RepID=A0ACD1GAK2_9EURO|nr:rhamnosidase B precursor [Aspergillus brunneoviolaceus CBS 621.78]RAH46141.1 rhamnosidase B precursor [Aspergillus brunneoviolaceus CBS 621.78]
MHIITPLLIPAVLVVAARVPYREYILAPSSRVIVNGSVTNANGLTGSSLGTAVFHGVSSVTYDFGKNVAGLVSLTVGFSSSPSAFLGVTFSESSLWESSEACDATGGSGLDAPLWFPVGQKAGTYTPDSKYVRGGIRYLTVVSNTSATIPLNSPHITFTAAPDQDLQAYQGWFHSNDELLNEIWYAGAYTNQLCTIDPTYGSASSETISTSGLNSWYKNLTIANGTSTVTDGAKRDRAVWPGDMSISRESIAVSTNDLYSVRMGLEALLALQSSEGQLPWGGKPFNIDVSYTYHLHSVIGMSFLYRFSGDKVWLSNYWSQYSKGVEWAYTNWASIADGVKSAANQLLWDDQAGLYRDNQTTELHPQDGNAWAVKANLTLSGSQIRAISQALKARWGRYGAPAPEAGATISPFIGGFEVQSHFLANQPDSTFIEGYSTDGSIYYAPYANDARISHAHGWSTGPTYALTAYAAGLQLLGPAGNSWLIAPQPGGLTSIDCGLATALGVFSVVFERDSVGRYDSFSFGAPTGTTGRIELPGVRGTLVSTTGQRVQLVNGTASGSRGGKWKLIESAD